MEILGTNHFPRVVVECDSAEAIATINNNGSGSLVNPYLELVRAIHHGIPPRIEVQFHHILREANSLADCLAKSTHVFGFGTHVLHSPLAECRSLLFQDVEEALASLRAPVV